MSSCSLLDMQQHRKHTTSMACCLMSHVQAFRVVPALKTSVMMTPELTQQLAQPLAQWPSA